MKKNSSFDIIITTNNRAESILTLIDQIQKHSLQPKNIIVVDSSDNDNKQLKQDKSITYIRSSHKNQPYQRYVGYMIAKSEIILYLDDDMEINNDNAMKIILSNFQTKDILGLAINFINDNEFLTKKVPKSIFKKKNTFFTILKNFTGQVNLAEGKYYFNGLKGKQPLNGGETEWFSGGAFAIKRDALYKDFNFQLFNLYEQKLGKGEDGIIGYTLSKQGKLYFEPNILFIHCDKKDSTYTNNMFSFSQRVIYSRLYLSQEFARLNNKISLFGVVFYHWYTFWRVLGLVVNQLIKNDTQRKSVLNGYLSGWKKTFKKSTLLNYNKEYWTKEALNDINKK